MLGEGGLLLFFPSPFSTMLWNGRFRDFSCLEGTQRGEWRVEKPATYLTYYL
jgi:hypothetical protein